MGLGSLSQLAAPTGRCPGRPGSPRTLLSKPRALTAAHVSSRLPAPAPRRPDPEQNSGCGQRDFLQNNQMRPNVIACANVGFQLLPFSCDICGGSPIRTEPQAPPCPLVYPPHQGGVRGREHTEWGYVGLQLSCLMVPGALGPPPGPSST